MPKKNMKGNNNLLLEIVNIWLICELNSDFITCSQLY